MSKSVNTNPNANLSTTSDTVKNKDKDKDKKKDGNIHPDAMSQCQKVVDYWQLDHYEAVPGKMVGILPREDTYGNNQKLLMLKDTLGFNYVNASESYIISCLQAGYTSQAIMIGGLVLTNNDYQRLIPLYPGYLGYYTDEPVSNSVPTLYCADVYNKLTEIRNFMNANGSGSSKLVVGETINEFYTWEHYSQCVVNSANVLMCTRYHIIRLYPPYPDPDQRDIWTEWKSDYPAKFNWTWISFDEDYEEFDDLIGHASNLGLEGVWLYQWEDGIGPAQERSRLEGFSSFAWKWGYLSRVERKWTYVYECQDQNPCDCDPYHITPEWRLVDKYPTYETRVRTY